MATNLPSGPAKPVNGNLRSESAILGVFRWRCDTWRRLHWQTWTLAIRSLRTKLVNITLLKPEAAKRPEAAKSKGKAAQVLDYMWSRMPLRSDAGHCD